MNRRALHRVFDATRPANPAILRLRAGDPGHDLPAMAQAVRDGSETPGYPRLPSQAKFLLLDLGRNGSDLKSRLFERGVIVRPMGDCGLPQTSRISLGSRVENERLLRAIECAAIDDRTEIPSPVTVEGGP